ncbi:MAG: hypothetical protein ACP5O0_06860 [Acidimicrobiales bacterium]
MGGDEAGENQGYTIKLSNPPGVHKLEAIQYSLAVILVARPSIER